MPTALQARARPLGVQGALPSLPCQVTLQEYARFYETLKGFRTTIHEEASKDPRASLAGFVTAEPLKGQQSSYELSTPPIRLADRRRRDGLYRGASGRRARSCASSHRPRPALSRAD